jgi:hypothetical protein
MGWILERDAGRVREIPENMLVSSLAIHHVHRCVDAASTAIPIPADIDLSKLAEIMPDDAPPKDNKLRAYLTQRDVGPDQLRRLKPESLAFFGAALLDYIGRWYVQAGKSNEDAETLARRALRELDEWLVASGVRARLQDLAQRRVTNVIAGNALAKTKWDDALARLVAELGRGRVKATGRRNGSGNPESLPASYWPLLTFSDRDFKGRGLLTCACFRADANADCWSDLRFDAEHVLTVWPTAIDRQQAQRESEDGVTGVEPTVDRPRARSARRASQRDATERAITALWPNGSPIGSLKTITAAINVWLKKQNASPVSEDTVSRVLRAQRSP